MKAQWSKEGKLLYMSVDTRLPQPSEFGDLGREAYLGDPSSYEIKDGKAVTHFGNREYAYTFYKLAEADKSKTPSYVAARSNEFGYANYEIVEAPVFLGTEVKDATVPQ